jgi:hypothetical protein
LSLEYEFVTVTTVTVTMITVSLVLVNVARSALDQGL